MFEMMGTGAAPAVTAWAVDAGGVATSCAMLFCPAPFERGLVAAGVVDDDAAGKDTVIDGVVADEEATDDGFSLVDVDNTAVEDEPCEIAAAPVVCIGALLAAVIACDNAELCAVFWTTLTGLATVAIVD